MKIPKKISIERIYETKAYDLLEAYCDDDQGGGVENTIMADNMIRNQVVNLIIYQLQKELKSYLGL